MTKIKEWTITEVAKELKMSRMTVHRAIVAKKIEAKMKPIGLQRSQWFISDEELARIKAELMKLRA